MYGISGMEPENRLTFRGFSVSVATKNLAVCSEMKKTAEAVSHQERATGLEPVSVSLEG